MNHLVPVKMACVVFVFTTGLILQPSLRAPSIPFLYHFQVKALIIHAK